MPVQNGMGEPALDFHVCHEGLYASIETKAPGKHPTPRQINTIKKVRFAKGSVFLIDSDLSLDYSALRGWLKQPFADFASPSVLIELEHAANESRNDRLGNPQHAE